MSEKHFRQGDVLITRINGIPEGKTKLKIPESGLILAEGEATGHHHRLQGKLSVAVLDPETQDIFLDLRSPGEVVHEEHGPIQLTPGQYRVRRQREYSPQEIRRVAD